MKPKIGETVTLLSWPQMHDKFREDCDGDLELTPKLVFSKSLSELCGMSVAVLADFHGELYGEINGQGVWFTSECTEEYSEGA